MSKLATTGLLALWCSACSAPPVIGFWESDAKLANGKRNKLEVYEDFSGSAKIYATPANDPATWVQFEFDVQWWDMETWFDFAFDCKEGPCDGKTNDFDFGCDLLEIEEGVDVLDCDATKKWKSYVFQWQRDL